ncbi:hypothetical protein [Streptosporangium carneum]|uniref:Uncharacterized protein n=1 Tax=Streptosporangium carneum TaxID=47481 RepID=A0A9W6IB82_9ACTN|nr:hypothetical protein [Streptosporangium carneum]GLK15466.1 hypothetical protein GCM10017600_88790 [Streptosporangium carneum]
MGGLAERYEDQVVAGPGGVMTDEVGVVTGDLTVVTEADDDQAHVARVRVQYTGAEEWYTLTGSPIPLAGRSAGQVHQAVLRAAATGAEGGVSADHLRS